MATAGAHGGGEVNMGHGAQVPRRRTTPWWECGFDGQGAVNSWQTVNGGEDGRVGVGRGRRVVITPRWPREGFSCLGYNKSRYSAKLLWEQAPVTVRASRLSRNTSTDRASQLQPVSACESLHLSHAPAELVGLVGCPGPSLNGSPTWGIAVP